MDTDFSGEQVDLCENQMFASNLLTSMLSKTLMCVKVSICFFILRLPVSKAYIRPLQLAIAVLCISHAVVVLLWVLQCIPVRSAWNPRVPGKCFSRQQRLSIVLAQAIMSIIGDFGLAFYPILIFRRLNMSLRQKIGLSLLMGLGVVAGACGIVRAILNDGAIPIDQTYGGITNWFWRLFEVNVGIVCACIPTLIPGFRWVIARFRGDLSHKRALRGQQLRDEGEVPQHAVIPNQMVDSPHNNTPDFDTSISRSDRALLGREQERIGLGDLESYVPDRIDDSRSQPPSTYHQQEQVYCAQKPS